MNLAQARVRTVNQLHALLRDLPPGGAPTQLTADLAAELLRSVRPTGDAEIIRKDIAWDLIAEIRKLDKQLTDNAARMQSLVEASGSLLMDTPGIGPVMAARLIGRTGRAHRFPTSASFANYAGAAPVEIASADKARHRLSRSGDRQLNSVLHTIAVVQIPMPNFVDAGLAGEGFGPDSLDTITARTRAGNNYTLKPTAARRPDDGQEPASPAADVAYAADRLLASDPSDSERATAELLNHIAATWDKQDLPLRQHTQAVARALTR